MISKDYLTETLPLQGDIRDGRVRLHIVLSLTVSHKPVENAALLCYSGGG